MISAKSECRWSVAMRRLLLAAMMFGAASGAQAADMPDFLRGSCRRPERSDPKLGRLVCRRPGRLFIVQHGFQPEPRRPDEFHFSQQHARDADVATVGAGQGQPARHRLRRVRRPQLAMGRPRFRCRGQLQLHQQPRGLLRRPRSGRSNIHSARTVHACRTTPRTSS